MAQLSTKKDEVKPEPCHFSLKKMQEAFAFIEKGLQIFEDMEPNGQHFSNGWLVGFYVIYKALCFNVAQGRMNGAPNETRTHSCRSASLAC